MSKRRWRATALALTIIAFIGLAIVWEFGSMMVAPTLSEVEAATLPARDIMLTTSDKLRIAATY